MTIRRCSVWIFAALTVWQVAWASNEAVPVRDTTASAIAIANLNHQIAQLRDDAGSEDLLLVRSRFFADYDALDHASALSETRATTSEKTCFIFSVRRLNRKVNSST